MILTHFIAFVALSGGGGGGGSVPELGLRTGGTAIGFYPLKSPASVRDAAVQWQLEDGETIVASAWAVLPAQSGGLAVVAGSGAVDGLVAACRIEGGLFRQVYTLINTITTSRGQVLQESMTFRIGLVEMAT